MDNCKCNKQYDIPRIVKGNDFTIMVTVERPVLSYKETFDLKECTDVKVVIVNRSGKRTLMPFTITEEGLLQIDFDENTPVGLYGFEISGKDADGRDWRFYAKPGEWIQVVNASSEERDPDCCDNTIYYDKTVEFGFATVSGQLLAKMRLAINDEESRKEAEKKRADAEEERRAAEERRIAAEKEREANEEKRIANDKNRTEGVGVILYDVVDGE